MTKFKLTTLGVVLITSLLITKNAFACLDMPCDLKQVAKKLNQPALSQFKQIKTIKVLSQPLESKGYLLLEDAKGLVWQTVTPIKSTTVITADQFQQFNKNDQPLTIPANANQSSGKIIATTFMNILSGNIEQLEQHFQVQSACNDHGWELQLTPDNAEVKQLIKHISIQGRDQIKQVMFTEINDDVTRLIFNTENDDKSPQGTDSKSQTTKKALRQYFER